jgi:hypothetical protein
MMQKMCIYVCNCKNDSFKTIPWIRGGGIKENGWRGEFNYDIVDRF